MRPSNVAIDRAFLNQKVVVNNCSGCYVETERAVKICCFLKVKLRIPNSVLVDVTFVKPNLMADLHMRYMGLLGSTDVLSFPVIDVAKGPVDPTSLQDEPTLGDIVICPDFIESNTQSDKTQVSVDACIIHGMVHLLGYDHQNNADAATMSRLENQLTRGWAQFKR